MKFTAPVLAVVLALAGAAFTADSAAAKDKVKKPVAKGQVERQKNGPKAIPPGQVKRYTRGNALPKGVHFDAITDLDRWNLKPLKKGQKYIKVGDEVLKVNDAMEVIDVVGDVAKLLK
ncbi:hypothetical protein [Shimia sp. SDUM112013]|uniref:hypothetical protein n=1 Tax=Shimia sp. SDUM112013 TaxID=3136160 RepID=UPI0032EDE9B1